jgi:hypothetical protein
MYLCFKGKKEEVSGQSDNALRDIADPLIAVKGEAEDNVDPETDDDRGMIWFHLFMMLISIYLSMMMTNWGSANIGDSNYGNSWLSTWVKFSAQWVTMLLYLWSLIAPLVCTGRDFS